MTIKSVIAPVADPIALEEAKQHLRVDGDHDNELIASYIGAATDFIQARTNRKLITSTFKVVLDCFPSGMIELPLSPLQSVESIKYRDSDKQLVTWDITNYKVSISDYITRIVAVDSWPSLGDDIDAVEITCVVGYGDTPDSIPSALKSAILLFVGHLYENRESVTTFGGRVGGAELPMGVDALISQYKILSVQ